MRVNFLHLPLVIRTKVSEYQIPPVLQLERGVASLMGDDKDGMDAVTYVSHAKSIRQGPT